MDSQSIIEELKKLNKISSQLDISQEERASLLNQTAEYTNNFISTLHTIKGYQENSW